MPAVVPDCGADHIRFPADGLCWGVFCPYSTTTRCHHRWPPVPVCTTTACPPASRYRCLQKHPGHYCPHPTQRPPAFSCPPHNYYRAIPRTYAFPNTEYHDKYSRTAKCVWETIRGATRPHPHVAGRSMEVCTGKML